MGVVEGLGVGRVGLEGVLHLASPGLCQAGGPSCKSGYTANSSLAAVMPPCASHALICKQSCMYTSLYVLIFVCTLLCDCVLRFHCGGHFLVRVLVCDARVARWHVPVIIPCCDSATLRQLG